LDRYALNLVRLALPFDSKQLAAEEVHIIPRGAQDVSEIE